MAFSFSKGGRVHEIQQHKHIACDSQLVSVVLTLETSKGGGQMDPPPPQRFFRPKIWSFQAIKMKLTVPAVWWVHV